jgi:hypothetical protein
MYIKQVKKNNTPNGKVFLQYQLTETYRVDGTVKQRAILYLGYHELLATKQSRHIVAKLVESRIKNEPMLSEDFVNSSVELAGLADEYYRKYLQKNQQELSQNQEPEEDKTEYDTVDISTTKVFDCREIGAEWMCYEMLRKIGLREFLALKGWTEQSINYSLISIISRAVGRSSEHKTEDWLKHNSGLTELFDKNIGNITRHHLYKASSNLYNIKDELEEFFYGRVTNMFEIKNSLIIYDLTNTYFEGRKEGSKIAKYGRSKEKRYDCKQVVLAAVVNGDGFLKHSRIYEGNISDTVTLLDLIGELQKSNNQKNDNQIIVIDAGIATEDNLLALRQKGLKYVCVSRSKPKERTEIDLESAVEIKDTRGGKIQLKFMDINDKSDKWVYVKSEGKTKKEESMLEQALQRYEEELEEVSKGISKKGGTKKADKVWERIGRIKERNQRSNRYYEINVEVKEGIVEKISWFRKPDKQEPKRSGEYFLRTNYEVETEVQIWEIYNTIREVESTFRCLKTDLNLRPVFHQKDEYVEAHLHLGLLAYQIVAPIRYMLKKQGIHNDWRNILRLMSTQKAASVSLKTKEKSEIIIRSCSRPNQEVLEIYKALEVTSMPFGIKKYVVHH